MNTKNHKFRSRDSTKVQTCSWIIRIKYETENAAHYPPTFSTQHSQKLIDFRRFLVAPGRSVRAGPIGPIEYPPQANLMKIHGISSEFKMCRIFAWTACKRLQTRCQDLPGILLSQQCSPMYIVPQNRNREIADFHRKA